ncbi:ubiquinol-cytochrome C reductase core subunit 2 [Ceratobasidium sp. AG-Ba]|nr:ubiquinol-cytochrome C reductase core subunit 2 [Ceratobasidium sp. AG-Ba]QRV99426.1 ubiquinol-cytochrome C reductase core subunit 2 [Ceratobasidium sp. AG-Ba]QRW13933.1 ubiquinol-cytochrome C reductase core subunit 2 [Ceratobasidium sp. AG-Ba]
MLSRTALRTTAAIRARSYATVADAGGLKVAAVDHGHPLSAVTLLVKAGSRYEPQQGIAHLLKNFAFKATNQRSELRIAREAELFGGVLSSTLTREHLAITAEFLRGDEAYFTEVLSSVLTSTAFYPHELTEGVAPNAIAETTAALADPATHALELAHALAFRSTGLGHSLFAAHPTLKSLDSVKQFASSAFTKGNVAVIGTGIDQGKLSQLVEKYLSDLPSGAALGGGSTQYFGGETRVSSEGHGQAVFIGFGAPGASPELAVLHAHLDRTPALKWTAGSSPFAGTGAAPVYIPYSDAALFGVIVKGDNVAADAKTAVSTLKKVASGLGAEETKKAVAKAKFAAAAALEGREGLVAAVAPQVFGASKSDLASVHAALDKVSESSVSKALSSLVKAKPTYVAVGDIHSLPYADELGL